jgi:hypothetical protein
MNARLRSAAIVLATMLAQGLAGCDDGDGGPFLGDPDYVRDEALDVEMVSAHGEMRSHEVGENCMKCHQARGPGPGRFTAAGTVHDADGTPHPDASVELRSTTGELVLRIAADSNGTFYTTEPLPLPDDPVFPVVFSSDGARTRAMPFPTNSAACNVCHVGRQIITLPEA